MRYKYEKTNMGVIDTQDNNRPLCTGILPQDGELIVNALNEVNKISSNNCVSGNEANPEIKQSGEVAVCDCIHHEFWKQWEKDENKCCNCGKPIKQTDR